MQRSYGNARVRTLSAGALERESMVERLGERELKNGERVSFESVNFIPRLYARGAVSALRELENSREWEKLSQEERMKARVKTLAVRGALMTAEERRRAMASLTPGERNARQAIAEVLNKLKEFPIEERITQQNFYANAAPRQNLNVTGSFGSHLVLARDKAGKVVGMGISQYDRPSKTGLLAYNMINPEMRGKGLGGLMVDMRAELGKRLGVDHLMVETERVENKTKVTPEMVNRLKAFNSRLWTPLANGKPIWHEDAEVYTAIKQGETGLERAPYNVHFYSATGKPPSLTQKQLREVMLRMYDKQYGVSREISKEMAANSLPKGEFKISWVKPLELLKLAKKKI